MTDALDELVNPLAKLWHDETWGETGEKVVGKQALHMLASAYLPQIHAIASLRARAEKAEDRHAVEHASRVRDTEILRIAIDTARAERDAAEARSQALEAQVRVLEGGWQWIETAPREHGERFLAWDPDVGLLICDRYGDGFRVAWDGSDASYITHWRPLPAPPSNPEAQSNG